MARFSKGRNVVWTLNNPTVEEENAIKLNIEMVYVCFGHEVGESGTPHLQGYAEAKKQMTMTWWKRQLGDRIHLELRKGNQEQAILYTQKEDKENWFERGTKAKQTQGRRTDLERIKEIVMVEKGTMVDVINECTGYQALRGAQIMMTYRGYKKLDCVKKIYWFYGGTGLGKTKRAWEEAAKISPDGSDVWVSNDSLKWFDGYYGQKNVIIDDFRSGRDYCTFNFLLRLLDRYPVKVPIKGGYIEWEAENIWITTIKNPQDLYTFEGNVREDIGQLERRLTTVVNFDIQREVDEMFGIVENVENVEIVEN